MTIPIKIIPKKEFKNSEQISQNEIWNKIADKWEAYVVKKIPIVEEFLKTVVSECDSEKCLIVDLGCGNGRNMFKIKGLEYWSVDFSQEMIKNTEKYVKKEKIKSNLFVSKVSKLPSKFKDEMFDAGLFMATLHCLETKDERKKALKEFYRILKKNSFGLISVWNSDDKRFYDIKGDVYMNWKKEGKDYFRYYYLFDKQELMNLIKSVGFEIIEFYDKGDDRFSKKNWILKVRK